MDSLTHIVLGAAIGESILGKQLGKKAMLFGAIAATAPDVDVLVGIFMSDIDKAIFHRGVTHSFFFILISSIAYGWLLSRFTKKDLVNWKQITFLVFIVQFTQTLLDSLTSYGTQIFWPISDVAVSVSTISILDPIYTLPLLVSFVWLLIISGKHSRRLSIASAGIALSSLYLLFTIGHKYSVERAFVYELAKHTESVDALEVKPTLLNNMLWRGIADINDGRYLTGYFSRLDGISEITFTDIEGNHHLIKSYLHFDAIQKLVWISNGFYQIIETDDGFIFNDLRFGRVAEFRDLDTPYAFSYRLTLNSDSTDFDVDRIRLQIDRTRESSSIRDLWNRIFGLE